MDYQPIICEHRNHKLSVFYEIWLVKTNKRRTDMDTKKQNPVAVCRMHQEEWNPDPE